MRSIKHAMILAAGVAALTAQDASAEMPAGTPFAMRGVQLGITIDEFRKIAIPADGSTHKLETWCSNDQLPKGLSIETPSEDKADGIVDCQWIWQYGKFPMYFPHFVDIGAGEGPPTFRFIDSGGQLRLFRIELRANNKSHPGIIDALTRGYGAPKQTTEPFKTQAGGDFTSTTSAWNNGLSTITLTDLCRRTDIYCLTYDHTALGNSYAALQERRASAAASKI